METWCLLKFKSGFNQPSSCIKKNAVEPEELGCLRRQAMGQICPKTGLPDRLKDYQAKVHFKGDTLIFSCLRVSCFDIF